MCLDTIETGLVPFNLTCRSCGSSSDTVDEQDETFCNFCEGYVDQDGITALHSTPLLEKSVLAMGIAARNGHWLQGMPYADALAATKDPFLLYGAAHFYRFFSDFTYYDVNYNQGGFMYSNAEKRSDELQKNKYNAMALISKSKECLFKALKQISLISPNANLLYLKFMCNIRLKRYSQASIALSGLGTFKDSGSLFKYATMVISNETAKSGSKTAFLPDLNTISGSSNFFYYASKHLAKSGNLEDSIKILTLLTNKIYMPLASSYNRKVIDVSSASGLD